MSLVVAIFLLTLSATGASHTLIEARVAWAVQTDGYEISVGRNGVFVAGGIQLSMYDFGGHMVWNRQIGSSPKDRVYAVAAGPDGVYVGGTFGGGVTWCEGWRRWFCWGNGFLEKYDARGNLLWSHQYAPYGSLVTAISVYNETVYFAGYRPQKGALEHWWSDPEAGCCDHPAPILASYDANGTRKWEVPRSSAYYVTGLDVFSRGIFVSAQSPSPETSDCGFAQKCQNGYFFAYDHNGTLLWTQYIESDQNPYCGCSLPPNSYAYDIAADNSGVYGIGYQPHYSNKTLDGPFVRKYDFSGNLIWTRKLAGVAVSTSPLGLYIAGGTTLTKLDRQGGVEWSLELAAPFGIASSFSVRIVAASTRGIFAAGLVEYPDSFIEKIVERSSSPRN